MSKVFNQNAQKVIQTAKGPSGGPQVAVYSINLFNAVLIAIPLQKVYLF